MSDDFVLPPVPDVTLTPPALLGGPRAAHPGPSLGVPELRPPGTPPPSLTMPLGGIGPALPPGLLPRPDYFSPGTAPPSRSPLDLLGDLGTRRGLQADRDGAGTTLGDWVLRFMPYVPFLNEPSDPAPRRPGE
jgi:hypothetical protein